jgi:endonuclease YncB( thermonuclease family)
MGIAVTRCGKDSRMQIVPTMLMVLASMFQLSSLSGRTMRSDPVLVRSVIDGNTIDVPTIGHVRLLGIAAPAIGRRSNTDAPFAREARDRMASLVLGRWVRLEQDAAVRTVSNRSLVYVVTGDGVFVNAVLVRDGLARISARASLARLDELKRAEAEAQTFRRGIWGGAPSIPPAGYTRTSKKRGSDSSRIRIPKKNTRKK